LVFFTKKNLLGLILEDLAMKDVGKLYGHLVYLRPLGKMFCHLEHFVAIWNILWPFGTFCGHLVHFSTFGILYQEKSGSPSCRKDRFPAKHKQSNIH
jgi:hypothetical protein